MRKMTPDEVKRTQLEILDIVAGFCEERGINYWLDFGTLIGAVRHKGFIPWDDDIDIGMLRPDYNKFMAEFNDYNPRYKLVCYENDPQSEFPFGKVFDNHTLLYEPDEKGPIKTAINVDIWPYDNAPDDDSTVREMFRERDRLRLNYNARMLGVFDPARGNLLRRLCVYAFRFYNKAIRLFPRKSTRFYYVRKIAENSKRYASEDTKRIGNFMGWAKAICSKRAFTSFIDGEFEGKTYKIPAGYDEWLTEFYGDYMTLPPEKERVTHHSYVAYMKEE